MKLDIIELAELGKTERREKILKSDSYELLKLYAEERQNIVDFIPISRNDNVLEINSECGIISAKLAEKANRITTVEENTTYCTAATKLNSRYCNINYVNSAIKEFINDCDEKFDYIFIINDVYKIFSEKLLASVYNLLQDNGKLIIATNNKLGLKYWAGCQESLNGGFFVGIENYQLIKTNKRLYSKSEIERLLNENQIDKYRFLYPYPDYLFPISVYSDRRLPQKGELDNNIRNFEGERYLLFDEKKAYDTIIEENIFPIYSNSYLVIIDR